MRIIRLENGDIVPLHQLKFFSEPTDLKVFENGSKFATINFDCGRGPMQILVTGNDADGLIKYLHERILQSVKDDSVGIVHMYLGGDDKFRYTLSQKNNQTTCPHL